MFRARVVDVAQDTITIESHRYAIQPMRGCATWSRIRDSRNWCSPDSSRAAGFPLDHRAEPAGRVNTRKGKYVVRRNVL